jgi:hypothetical protein
MGATGGCGTELDEGSVVVAAVAVVVTADGVVSGAASGVETDVVSEVLFVDPQAAKKMNATTVVTETRTIDRMGDGRRMSS